MYPLEHHVYTQVQYYACTPWLFDSPFWWICFHSMHCNIQPQGAMIERNSLLMSVVALGHPIIAESELNVTTSTI